MTLRARLLGRLVLSLCATLGVASWLAACGGSVQTLVLCKPACPAGTRCTEEGCVSDGTLGGDDLRVTVDAAVAGCSPACTGATPICNDSGNCVGCASDSDCPVNTSCHVFGPTVASCLPGCSDDSRCGGAARLCCGGGCVDPMTDGDHCGDCATVCVTPHAGAPCVAGRCTAGACQAGWGDCNRDSGDGCETNLRIDVKNCGGCGATCTIAHAAPGCSSNGSPRCYIAACSFGFADCNGDAGDGCEVDVLANSQNCGGCGARCASVSHGRNNCLNGGCQLTSCDAGFGDCDGQLDTGCEVGLNSDITNCGKCGNKCGQGLVCIKGECTCPNCILPNAKAACINLSCEVASCTVNWGNCDGKAQNGCEQNLTADARNCGACGAQCAQGLVCVNGSCTCPNCTRPNGRTNCINGVCGLESCFNGFGNCNGNPDDGCEADFDIDRLNCGACGTVCPMNKPACIAGSCSDIVKSCMEILDAGLSVGDGVYQIDPDGQGGKDPFDVYCDMTTDGGGWEVQAYLRDPSHWDWKYYSDHGAIGDTDKGFASAQTLKTADDVFNEKIIIYLNLVEMKVSLGKQWMVVRRSDDQPIPFSKLEATDTGWSYRDSYGKTDLSAGSVCTHGCTTYRGNGMFHDQSGIAYHGTQTGDNGCRDGNNICWMSRSLGCNVGDARCAYLTGKDEGVVYAVRNK